MASRPMIKHLNIIEDCRSRGFTSFKDVASDFLLLQTAEEGLDGRVIMTISSATHAREQAMRLTEPIPFVTTVLRTLIRVNNDVLLGLASPNSHQQGIQHNFLGQGRLHGPADDPAGVQIHHHGQVEQPPLIRPNIGDVGHPRMIRPVFRKLSLQTIRGRYCRLGVAHAWLLIPALGEDFVTLHELGNPVLAHVFPNFAQIAENARRAIGATTRFIRFSNEAQ